MLRCRLLGVGQLICLVPISHDITDVSDVTIIIYSILTTLMLSFSHFYKIVILSVKIVSVVYAC